MLFWTITFLISLNLTISSVYAQDHEPEEKSEVLHLNDLQPNPESQVKPSQAALLSVQPTSSAFIPFENNSSRAIGQDISVSSAARVAESHDISSVQDPNFKLLDFVSSDPYQTQRAIHIHVPSKSWFEVFAPLLSAIISLFLGWGFSVWMYNRNRQAQINDRDDSRREGLSDEFWLRKTVFPMFQHRLKSYCEKSEKYWDEFELSGIGKLQDYLEFFAQAEHHNLLLMIEKIQPTVSKILTENVSSELIDIFDELEQLYQTEFLKLSAGADPYELMRAKVLFKERIATIEYSSLSVLHKSLEDFINRPRS